MNRFSLWLDERLHLSSLIQFLSRKSVPRHKHSFWYIFGGLALFFFLVQLITGVLLLLYYSPTPETANESVRFIESQVPYGWFVRSLHAWSANLMVATVLVHLFSTYFMRAYRRPRELMWVSGLTLLLVVLGFGFTGYLLPWDTTAYFATQIGTEIPRTILTRTRERELPGALKRIACRHRDVANMRSARSAALEHGFARS